MKRALARLAGVVVLLSLSLSLAAQTPTPPKPPAATGLIVGQVIDGTTGRPIADATVYADTPENGVATTSDGRFVIRGVKATAGPFLIGAIKPGYLLGSYGQTRPGGIGSIHRFAEGEKRTGVVIKMWRFATITGRILDEVGEPVVGLEVRAARRMILAGEWRFRLSGDMTAYTDDRGIYKLSVEPGNWIVATTVTTATVPTSVVELQAALAGDAAQSDAFLRLSNAMTMVRAPRSLPGASTSDAVGDLVRNLSPGLGPTPSGDADAAYRTQFFVGALGPSRAEVVALEAGQVRTGVDFVLQPVRTVRVSGFVTAPGGPASNIPLSLYSNDTVDIDGDVVTSATFSDEAGRFTFLGVPPGSYSIRTVRPPWQPVIRTQIGSVMRMERGPIPPDAPTLWARHDVDVGGNEVTNVSVSLSRGLRIGGRLAFDGIPAGELPADFRGGQLLLEAADGHALEVGYPLDRISLTAPQFLSIELPPGKYLVRAPGYAWGLKSAISGGRDVSEAALTLDDHNVTDLVVTFSKQTSILRGRILTARNEPAADSVVLAFPADPQSWTGTGLSSRRFQLMRAGHDGAYELYNLRAGDYYLIALADDPGSDWKDPKSLARWSVDAIRLSVGTASATGPDLRLRQSGPGSEDHGPFVDDEAEFVSQARAAEPAAPDSGQITGIVVTPDGATTSPVRRAIVTLTCATLRIGRTIVTDETGRFVFTALPTCRYELTATKVAYMTTRYGATRTDRPGTPITLAAGQRADVRLIMPRGGVITGVVRDSRGDPMAEVSVQVMRFQFTRGEQQLEPVPNSGRQTDRDGVYRIYGLPPGDFVVAAAPRGVGASAVQQLTIADVEAGLREARGGVSPASVPAPAADAQPLPSVAYAPTFHPRTTAPAEAALVKVEAGEERAGIDITVELRRMSRITLNVTGADGTIPGTSQAQLAVPQSVGGIMSPISLILPMSSSTGRITLPPVPPGQYTIAVSGARQAPPPPISGSYGMATSSIATIAMPEWAIVPVSLTGDDIEISVRLEQGRTVSGRVVFDGANPPAEFRSVSIGLSGPMRAGVSLSNSAKPVTVDGRFALDGVVPAAYRVTSPAIKGWSLASAIINGQDAADRPVEISSDLSNVVVTFTDKTTDFSGTLQSSAGQPATDYHVIVFPADRSYWIYGSRRIVSLRPGTDGRFTTTALPAGEYLVAAVTDVVNEEWFNLEFLATLEPSGVRVAISLGQKTVQNLRIK